MAMVASLGAPGAGKLFLSHVNACAIEAVCLLIIDALSFETLMKLIPRPYWWATVPFAIRAPTNEAAGFGVEHCRDRMAATLPDHANNLALGILVPANSGNAIFFSSRRPTSGQSDFVSPKRRQRRLQPAADPHRRDALRQSSGVIGLDRDAAQRRRPERRLEARRGNA